MKKDGAPAIEIVPEWTDQPWFHKLTHMATSILRIPQKGVHWYCLGGGKPVAQRPENTLALLFKGHQGFWGRFKTKDCRSDGDTDDSNLEEEEEEVTKSTYVQNQSECSRNPQAFKEVVDPLTTTQPVDKRLPTTCHLP